MVLAVDESGNLATRSEVTSEVDAGQLLHEYKAVSCERDIINEELQRMSEELKKVTERLVQSQVRLTPYLFSRTQLGHIFTLGLEHSISWVSSILSSILLFFQN